MPKTRRSVRVQRLCGGGKGIGPVTVQGPLTVQGMVVDHGSSSIDANVELNVNVSNGSTYSDVGDDTDPEMDNLGHVLEGDLAVVSASRQHKFADTYKRFEHAAKYILPSGDTVEDILFRAQTTTTLSNSVAAKFYDWVVDLDDPKVQALFKKDDLAQLLADLPELPSVTPELAQYLYGFVKV